jgi:hypothetical protein
MYSGRSFLPGSQKHDIEVSYSTSGLLLRRLTETRASTMDVTKPIYREGMFNTFIADPNANA